MGIMPEQFVIVWQGIAWWLGRKGISPATLSLHTGYSQARIARGIRGEEEQVTSGFVHACVDFFGLRNSRMRGIEDTVDILMDEECVELLIAPLKEKPQQSKLWD
jgi:hypothetical protein